MNNGIRVMILLTVMYFAGVVSGFLATADTPLPTAPDNAVIVQVQGQPWACVEVAND